MADGIATIEMARLLKRCDSELFDVLYVQRSRAVSGLIDVQQLTPLVHVSGMFGGARHNLALVAPVAWHPRNNSEVICVDLGRLPDFLECDPAVIREQLFTPRDELPEDFERPPIKTIRLTVRRCCYPPSGSLVRSQRHRARWRSAPPTPPALRQPGQRVQKVSWRGSRVFGRSRRSAALGPGSYVV